MLLLIRLPGSGVIVTFLDVGQGDCACIQTDAHSGYLIDGGSSTVSGVGTYRILPFLKASGIRKIKGIFVSHMDEDHVNGILELLERGGSWKGWGRQQAVKSFMQKREHA